MTLAEIACSSDTTCIGILDEGCDNAGNYRLCKNAFTSPTSSCIYQKKAYTGGFFISLVSTILLIIDLIVTCAISIVKFASQEHMGQPAWTSNCREHTGIMIGSLPSAIALKSSTKLDLKQTLKNAAFKMATIYYHVLATKKMDGSVASLG